jgi:hypothetical protein
VPERKRQEARADPSGLLVMVGECHKAVVHAPLLMTGAEPEARAISNQINFGCLIAPGATRRLIAPLIGDPAGA